MKYESTKFELEESHTEYLETNEYIFYEEIFFHEPEETNKCLSVTKKQLRVLPFKNCVL